MGDVEGGQQQRRRQQQGSGGRDAGLPHLERVAAVEALELVALEALSVPQESEE